MEVEVEVMKQKGILMANLQHKMISFIIAITFLFNSVAHALVPDQEIKEDAAKVKLHAVLTPPYIIGPGDQLIIIDRTLKDVFGQVEQYNVIVSADGFISIPLPDGTQQNILAAGYTLDELSNDVRTLFGKTLRNPLVYIQINKYRPINVYIGGEIVKPGVYKIEGSGQEAGVPLSQVIQVAGGIKPRGDVTLIVVTRGASLEKKIINLLALLTEQDISQDINLQPGDTIYIPPAGNEQNQAQNHIKLLGKIAYSEVPINVVGQVKSGGSFTLPNDATLIDAIGHAGGISDVGTLSKIKISRYDEDGIFRTQKINLNDLIKKGASFDQIALKPNDTIEIEVSKIKATGNFLRQTGKNFIPIAGGAVASGYSTFLMQNAILDKTRKLGKSSIFNRPSLPISNPITIIGD